MMGLKSDDFKNKSFYIYLNLIDYSINFARFIEIFDYSSISYFFYLSHLVYNVDNYFLTFCSYNTI